MSSISDKIGTLLVVKIAIGIPVNSIPNVCVGLPDHQCVDPQQRQLGAAVAAGIAGALFSLDGREGRIDVANVIARLGRVCRIPDAIKNKLERIELRPQHEAAFLVPYEWLLHLPSAIHVPEIAGEGSQIMGRV